MTLASIASPAFRPPKPTPHDGPIGVLRMILALRRNPLFRALRVDKLITQALETSLRHLVFEEWDAIPALRMIRMGAEEIRARAERIRACVRGVEIIEGRSVAGGGSTPDQSLPTWLLVILGDAVAFERALRSGDPPVIARIEEDRLILDLRTVFPEQDAEITRRLGECV